MPHQKILFTNNVVPAIDFLISEADPDGIWIIADTDTARMVVPSLRDSSQPLAGASLITLKQGDDHKTIEALTGVWEKPGVPREPPAGHSWSTWAEAWSPISEDSPRPHSSEECGFSMCPPLCSERSTQL